MSFGTADIKAPRVSVESIHGMLYNSDEVSLACELSVRDFAASLDSLKMSAAANMDSSF